MSAECSPVLSSTPVPVSLRILPDVNRLLKDGVLADVDTTPGVATVLRSMRRTSYKNASQAIFELVDNSIDAMKAVKTPKVWIRIDEALGFVTVADNGKGMDAAALQEALCFGSRGDYDLNSKGTFGCGLKTAALFLGRRFVVRTRDSSGLLLEAVFDTASMVKKNKWLTDIRHVTSPAEVQGFGVAIGGFPCGTVVLVDQLDSNGITHGNGMALACDVAKDLGETYYPHLSGTVAQKVGIELEVPAKRSWPIKPTSPLEPDFEKRCAAHGLALSDDRIMREEGIFIKIPPSAQGGWGGDEIKVEGFYGDVRDQNGDVLDSKTIDKLYDFRPTSHTCGVYYVRNGRVIQRANSMEDFDQQKHPSHNHVRIVISFGPALDIPFGVTMQKNQVSLQDCIKSNKGIRAKTAEFLGKVNANYDSRKKKDAAEAAQRALERVQQDISEGIKSGAIVPPPMPTRTELPAARPPHKGGHHKGFKRTIAPDFDVKFQPDGKGSPLFKWGSNTEHGKFQVVAYLNTDHPVYKKMLPSFDDKVGDVFFYFLYGIASEAVLAEKEGRKADEAAIEQLVIAMSNKMATCCEFSK